MVPMISIVPTILNHEKHKELYCYAVNRTDSTELSKQEDTAYKLIAKVEDKKLQGELTLALLDVASCAMELGFDAGAQLQDVITKSEYPRFHESLSETREE